MKTELNQNEESMESPTGCTEEVRDFYERMPYPAPLTSLDGHLKHYNNPDRRRAMFHLIWPTERSRANQEILVAGCGTSQAARYALREPDARITAIDISNASLQHTRQLQQKYNLENLELHNLSILDVQALKKTFDQVICTGVLHHLADPDLGLRSLRAVLKPDGAMQIMVYAPYGRTGIYMLQAYCRLLKITPSRQELDDLNATLDCLPKDHPVTRVLQRAEDFRDPNALADTLLHPQDRAFKVPHVYEWLEKCGMSFGRWVEQAPYLPQCGMVAKNPHAARLAALPSRLSHAAVELFRGTMVSHTFTAYRDDRPGENQPINFSGNSCREYVPIRLPWTMSIRENLPPGSVSVLINPAHRFTDLYLPIDPFENRLFGAIDGKRTLGNILEFLALENRSWHRVLSFFERLWQYDQIVFDASRAAEYSLGTKCSHEEGSNHFT